MHLDTMKGIVDDLKTSIYSNTLNFTVYNEKRGKIKKSQCLS